MISLTLQSADGSVRHCTEGVDEVTLGWRGEYAEGDRLVVACDEPTVRLAMQLDQCLAESLVILRGGRFVFPIPFGDARKSYGTQSAFAGERHYARVRVADVREAAAWRNLALNAHDLTPGEGALEGEDSEGFSLFPHASTNVSPRNPQFIARNAIDGVAETCLHGSWPHESWGVAGREDAWLRIDFGETVVADELRIYLRADFPHDTCWESGELELSSGEVLPLLFEKTGVRQSFDLGHRNIEWLRLRNLKKRDEEGFPGLAQIEVWGRANGGKDEHMSA